MGRDIGSGARYILLAETGIGTANSNSLVQYEPTVTSGTITDIVDTLSAGGTINLITFPAGAGGYPSFSTVQTVLQAVSTPSVGYVISYVTDSDAATVISHGAVGLTWNGVPYSVAGIQQGQYSYWSYLHVYYNSAYVSSLASPYNTTIPTLANDLANQIATDTTTGAILTTDVQVSRTADGGIVTQNY